LWVKIIDLDLARRRISLSIKQAAEGGELAEEYRGQFQVDDQGNWVGGDDSTREAAWAEYFDATGGAPAADAAQGENVVAPETQSDTAVAQEEASPAEAVSATDPEA
jgi:small subunit ribosomal protein S1